MLSKRKKHLAAKITLGLVFSLSAGLFSNTGFAAEDSYKNETIQYYVSGTLGITELISGQTIIGGADYTEVTITADNPDNKNATAAGMYVNPGADVTVLGSKIAITAKNAYNGQRSRAIEFGGASNSAATKLVLGSAATETIELVSHSQGESLGIGVLGGTNSQGVSAEINGGLLRVDVSGNSSNENLVSGIHVANNTANVTRPDKAASLEINAAKTVITSSNIGLSAYSNGTLKVKGDLAVEAETAVSARGYSKIEINKDKQNTVQLKGDVEFNYDSASSGTPIEADVTINLSDADSYLHGNIIKSGDFASTMTVNDKQKVTGMTLGLSNNAQWTTDADSFVNKLVLDNGIVNINGGKNQTVNVGVIAGSGGIINLATTKEENTFTSGVLSIGEEKYMPAQTRAINVPKLEINYTGITADDLNNVANDLGVLAQNIVVAEGTNTGLTAKANVAEGLLKGAVSADLDTAAGGSSIVTNSVKQAKESSTMTSMRNIASVAIVAWRQEDSTLSQRLGELRNSEGDQGIWVRMSRGEFEYSGAYKNQYNFFQLGYDKAFGSWHYGAAVSHNDGQTTYDNGKGENKSTSLSLYGTWLGDRGHYSDIVLKQGRLTNEYDNYAAAGHTHGDYHAWGTSLSGEYGMKVGLDNGWYVTPQAQLTLMRIGGEDYTTNNGIKVNQDTLESCVGRVGFEMGKTISDKGSIYAKASLLHEFAGNADTYLSLNSISNSYSQDIGGTWYEAGLGFNVKTTDNSYIYADVVKTFGDDIKTPWQWNVGARWTF